MMRTLASGLLGLTLAACNAASPASQEESKVQTQVKLSLPDLGQAPELQNEIWLNIDQPLLADSLLDRQARPYPLQPHRGRPLRRDGVSYSGSAFRELPVTSRPGLFVNTQRPSTEQTTS